MLYFVCVRYEAAKEESQIAYCLDLYTLDAGIRNKGHTNAPAFLLAVARQRARSSQGASVATTTPAPGGAGRGAAAAWLSRWMVEAPCLLIQLLIAVKEDLTKARKRPPPDQVGKVLPDFQPCEP